MSTPPSPRNIEGSPQVEDRRYSIDHAMELEHQLNQEEGEHMTAIEENATPSELDPDVLATIVIQQRTTLAEITSERDELKRALAKAHIVQSELHSQMAELATALEAERQRVAGMDLELKAAREQAANDAESIAMLRSKVEEARRGVMRLQSERESRRVSQFQPLQLDLSSPSTSGSNRTPAFSTFSKRASVITTATTPRSPTFMGHRRVSSLSDPGLTPDASDTLSSPPMMTQTPSEPATSSVGRTAGLSPPPSISATLYPAPIISEEDLVSLQAELRNLKRELVQAKEAKQASDTVLRALKEMIGMDPESKELPQPDQVESLKGLSLPPLPTDELEDEDDSPVKEPPTEEKRSGWGLRLWRSGPAPPVKPASPEPTGNVDPLAGSGADASKRSSASSSIQAEPPALTRTTSASSSSSPPPPPRKPLFKAFSLFSSANAPPVPEKDDAVLPAKPLVEESHAPAHEALHELRGEVPNPSLVAAVEATSTSEPNEQPSLEQEDPQSHDELHISTEITKDSPELRVQPPTAS